MADLTADDGGVDAGRIARSRVQGPAVGLLVTGIVGIVFSVFGTVLRIFGIGMMTLLGRPETDISSMSGIAGLMAGAIGIFLGFVGLAGAVFVTYGAVKMKAGKNHTLAIAASIVAMIPLLSPCCCIGLPIGIWALVVLLRDEVKAGFTA